MGLTFISLATEEGCGKAAAALEWSEVPDVFRALVKEVNGIIVKIDNKVDLASSAAGLETGDILLSVDEERVKYGMDGAAMDKVLGLSFGGQKDVTFEVFRRNTFQDMVTRKVVGELSYQDAVTLRGVLKQLDG